MADTRQGLHVLLSETAQRGIRGFVLAQGLTLSGLLESIGEALDQDVTGKFCFGPGRETIVERGRQIDAERRSRDGRGAKPSGSVAARSNAPSAPRPRQAR